MGRIHFAASFLNPETSWAGVWVLYYVLNQISAFLVEMRTTNGRTGVFLILYIISLTQTPGSTDEQQLIDDIYLSREVLDETYLLFVRSWKIGFHV